MKIVYTVAFTVAALLSASAAQDATLSLASTDLSAVTATPTETGIDTDVTGAAADATVDDADRSIDNNNDDIGVSADVADAVADASNNGADRLIDDNNDGVSADADVTDVAATDDNNDNVGADANDANYVDGGVADDDVGADADAVDGVGNTNGGDAAVNEDVTVAPATPTPTTAKPFNYPLARQQVIMDVNQARKNAGLSQICLSAKLMESAQSQASFQAKTNSVTVTGEDGSEPSGRGIKAGFNATAGVAELVGAGYTNSSELIAAWLASEDSKSIVLGAHTHLGPGISVDTNQQYVYYWAVDFSSGVNEPCSGLAA